MDAASRELKLEYSVEKPLNREPPIDELVSSFITTNKLGYDRNHGPIPYIDSSDYQVKVDGAVPTPLSLTINELATSFPQHSVTCALQCAGNRRHTMRTFLKEVDGIDWGDGAVMNCSWEGPRLRDVLLRAGIDKDDQSNRHVAFACYHTKVQDDEWYGSSIELSRGLGIEGEVILALKMNSNPLPANHGAPVRIIAPGIAGARSVKWLERITVQSTESQNFYQQRDYKILPPEAYNEKEAQKYWDKTPAIQDMPINSVVASPKNGETVRLSVDGNVDVRGYALPHGTDGPVVKVEVSTDGGKSWNEAELVGERSKWTWALWKTRVAMSKGHKQRILSRATDRAGNVQTNSQKWNLRGVAYNGYGESRDLTVID